MVVTIQLLSGLVGSLAFLSQASPGPLVTEQVRIMALRDSITGNPGCWRALLSHKLSATNIDLPLPYSQIRFVGTQQRTYCGFGTAYDWPHEGHGGFLATGIASTTVPILPIVPNLPLLAQPLLTSWLLNPDVSSLGRPVDIVLMHLGTNDIWQGRPTEQIIGAYGAHAQPDARRQPARASPGGQDLADATGQLPGLRGQGPGAEHVYPPLGAVRERPERAGPD